MTAPAPRALRVPAAAAFLISSIAFTALMASAGAPSALLVVYQREWGFPDSALTIAFSVYALTLLLALLVVGSLSDHVGRKPLLVGALCLQSVSMLVFLVAGDIGTIIVARALQGLATGAATTAFSAYITEIAPARRRRTAALVVSVASVGGIGLGAIVTGLAIRTSDHPDVIVFRCALLVFIAAAAVLAASPETMARRAGAVASLAPRLRVPPAARRLFGKLTPGYIGIWMAAGLMLGLAASIARTELHITDGLLSGLIVGIQPVAACVSTLALGGLFTAERFTLLGYLAVIAGVVVEAASFQLASVPLILLGAAIAGAGFGAAFSGSLRRLIPHAEPHERAGIFSAVYLVGYLAYGVPTVAAGFLADRIGVRSAATAFALVIVVVTVAAVTRQRESR